MCPARRAAALLLAVCCVLLPLTTRAGDLLVLSNRTGPRAPTGRRLQQFITYPTSALMLLGSFQVGWRIGCEARCSGVWWGSGGG
jgi:hypothetical protein